MPRNRQIRAIERQQRDARARGQLMQRLRDRHRDSWLRLDVRPTAGRDLLLAASELLVRTADLDGVARETISDAQFVVEEVSALRHRIARIRSDGADSDDVDRLKDALHRLGVAASWSYITPNRPIDKSEATPERARPRRRVELPPADPAVQVTVVDTGVNTHDRTDGWLDNLLTADNEDPVDVFAPLSKLDYAAGHGSFIAGQFRQVDERLDMHVTKVLDSDGVAGEVDVAVAMVAAVEEHLAPAGRLVVNLSLGTDTLEHEEPLALRVAVEITDEIQRERGGEVMLVCAAGNEGDTTRCWPAAFADGDFETAVVAVAALDAEDQPAGWSTQGDWVTCSAVGEALVSTFVKGQEDPDVDPDPETFGHNAWASWTGTSFAAPLVGAHTASIARERGISLADALHALLEERAIDDHPGYGTMLAL